MPTRWVIARHFFPVLEMLAEAGVEIDVASAVPHEHVFWEDYVSGATGSDRAPEHTFSVVLVYEEIAVSDYAAVLIPGGHSHHGIISDDLARRILSEAAAQGLVIGGVGQGVSVLLEFDLIAGHRATFGPGEEHDPMTPNDQRIIEEAGGTFVWDCVVTSGEPGTGFILVTARAQCVCSFTRAVLQAIESRLTEETASSAQPTD